MTLEGDATRPTSERAKEAIFSMIQFSLEGRRVLDLFAGSGQMALEALSRGASDAVAVDSSAAACKIIVRNAEACGFRETLTVIPDKLPQALRRLSGRKFDIVFIDPPYDAGLIPPVLKTLLELGLLSKYAYIVCESAKPEDVFGAENDLAAQFTVLKQTRYGAASVLLLRPSEDPENT